MTLHFDHCPVLVYYQQFWVVGEIRGNSAADLTRTATFWGCLGANEFCEHYEMWDSRSTRWYHDIVENKINLGYRRTSSEISKKVLNLVHSHMMWHRLTTE